MLSIGILENVTESKGLAKLLSSRSSSHPHNNELQRKNNYLLFLDR